MHKVAKDPVFPAIAPRVAAAPLGRRRRPSGEPPPLPRPVVASTRWYLAAIAVLVPLETVLAVAASRRPLTRLDDAVVRGVATLRTSPLDGAMRGLQHLGDPNVLRALSWATIAVLLVTFRLRHLITYLAAVLTAVLGSAWLANSEGRMRPTGVRILGEWSGYAHPSAPVVGLAAVCAGVLYTTAPRGRWRTAGTWLAASAVTLLCSARLVLAVDRPSDLLAALAIGWALPVVIFRLATPDEAFPIVYRRGTRAHLDVGGQRGAAITRALDQQLGIHANAVEPFGTGASAGSTPLRIGTRTGTVFAKLYAGNHLRADRWYKLSRMIRYGRLEDEMPFSTVRRLVEYEDHMLRLLRDAGLPTPRPYGLVEITPEREYLVVMEFFAGANEIGSRQLTQPEIDSGLAIVRQLWQAGVAHRDIKPSNLLVKDGRVRLIDVAFATVRPTPWRQAVDLANMMLTLALSSSPELVYQRALRTFAADDVAEAFAASRSVTIPSQLRSRLRADGRDLVAEFRALAPDRPAVPIQLWTLRRVGVTVGALLAAGASLFGAYLYASLAGLL